MILRDIDWLKSTIFFLIFISNENLKTILLVGNLENDQGAHCFVEGFPIVPKNATRGYIVQEG
jgi:hypothetical protein